MQETYSKLKEILITKFEIPESDIHPKAMLENLELDSLALMELALTVQQTFDIGLNEVEISPQQTLEEISTWIANQESGTNTDE
ncbi:acyl carrier protein [Lipingzhangella sp. LS1_29]|uniref:Acyl carrier protein n=1 Tax=Lipingzhangella rawalii TaxID=2055835 RepID=A0ABU2H6Y0_9ACTN|nr:acyl carrier protein [Lipingzhangella rawalii]MDS1271058.1 acyl carrier protein [Lipingzhangella rawalii]